MKSKTRTDSEAAELKYSIIVKTALKDQTNLTMLMVGTAGNPLTHKGKPGLDHPGRFANFNLTTVDFDAKWNPDIVCDISDPNDIKAKFAGQQFDLVHMTQVIEHIPDLFIVPECLSLLVKPTGFLIIDSPWGPSGPDYHGELPSFGDYWRISKDGFRALFQNKFDILFIDDTDANVSCLMKVK